MNLIKKDHATVLLGDLVYTIGGYNEKNDTCLQSCEAYEVSSDTWRMVWAMNTRRSKHAATKLTDTKILVSGGLNFPEPLSDIEIYDSEIDTWTRFPMQLTIGLVDHCCACYAKGKIVILGGVNQSQGRFNEVVYRIDLKNRKLKKSGLSKGKPIKFGARNRIYLHDECIYVAGVTIYLFFSIFLPKIHFFDFV